MSWLLALALGLVTLPDPNHTPGVVRPLTRQQVCSTKWGRDHRHVTTAMKVQVAAWYGVPRERWAYYEFDHLVPRELGGADDVRNIWPQPLAEARVKDRLENKYRSMVCGSTITLSEAQQYFRASGWAKAP